MEYTRQSDLKVTCIATVDDMDFFGITVDDILDRTEAGLHFLKKVKSKSSFEASITAFPTFPLAKDAQIPAL